MDKDLDKLSLRNENGFLWEVIQDGPVVRPKEEDFPNESFPEVGVPDNGSNKRLDFLC